MLSFCDYLILKELTPELCSLTGPLRKERPGDENRLFFLIGISPR